MSYLAFKEDSSGASADREGGGAALTSAADEQDGSDTAALRPLAVMRLLLAAELAEFPPETSPLTTTQQAAVLTAILAPLTAPATAESQPQDDAEEPSRICDEAAVKARHALAQMAEAGHGGLLAGRALPVLLPVATATSPPAAPGHAPPVQGHAQQGIGSMAQIRVGGHWGGAAALAALAGMAERGDPALRTHIVGGLAGAAPAVMTAAGSTGDAAAAEAAAAVLAALAAGGAGVAGAPELAAGLVTALLSAAASLDQVRFLTVQTCTNDVFAFCDAHRCQLPPRARHSWRVGWPLHCYQQRLPALRFLSFSSVSHSTRSQPLPPIS